MTFAAIIDPPMLESSPVVKAGEQARPRWVLVARSLLWALNSSGPLTVRLVGSAGERHSSQRGYRKFADQRFPTWDESEGLLCGRIARAAALGDGLVLRGDTAGYWSRLLSWRGHSTRDRSHFSHEVRRRGAISSPSVIESL